MSERSLASIIYQVSKMLVTLLEKEYGMGKKPQQYVEQIVIIKNVDRNCTS